ncbi:MAG: hypothetical protein ACFFCM_00380 [Promethearchaeota archaeon]
MTDFYLLEVIGLISLIFIIASVIFFILAVISENNAKLFAILGGGTSIINGVLFIISLIIGIA